MKNQVTKFVRGIRKELEEACYLMIFPNDNGYDIEVEANGGTIAGVFATDSHNLKNARKVADLIDKELTNAGVWVHYTRQSWENYLMRGESD